MPALHHDAHEPKRLKFGERLGLARRDSELDAVRKVLAVGDPANFAQLADMCRHHAFDRFQRAALAGNRDFDAIAEHALSSCRAQRHFVHIDEMLP